MTRTSVDNKMQKILFLLVTQLAVCTTAAATERMDGIYSCGPNLTARGDRSPQFQYDISLLLDGNKISGSRENDEVVEAFSGSLDAAGAVEIDLKGQYKNDSSRAWQARLSGRLNGSFASANGRMMSATGIRECSLTLKRSTGETPLVAGTATINSGQTMPAQPVLKFPVILGQRLAEFDRAIANIGNDPKVRPAELADEVDNAYSKANFGGSIVHNCSPLDGPYSLEHVGRSLAQRPFVWTEDMASAARRNWGEFVNACPGYAEIGDAFLARIRAITENRAGEIARLRSELKEKRSKEDAELAKATALKRLDAEKQDELSQKARAEQQRRAAAYAMQRAEQLKSGQIAPETIADAISLHDARSGVTLVYSPKVGPSRTMFSLTGILKNVIGTAFSIEVGDRVAEVRISGNTRFLVTELKDIRVNRQISIVGTYLGVDQNKGQNWAVFNAAFVQQ